jgi:hypothetical protein
MTGRKDFTGPAMTPFKKSLWLLLLVSLCGCDTAAERLFKERIAVNNETADRLENGTFDPIYAQKLWERTQAISHKQQTLIVSPDERKQLEDKYGPELARAEARVRSEMEKREKKPSSVPDTSADKPTEPQSPKPVDKEKKSSAESTLER